MNRYDGGLREFPLTQRKTGPIVPGMSKARTPAVPHRHTGGSRASTEGKEGKKTREPRPRAASTGDTGVASSPRPTAGVVTGWRALRGAEGEFRRSQMARILAECRLPPEILPPARSGHAHATRAMRLLEADYTVARGDDKRAWYVRDKNTGATLATVRITEGDEIRVDSDDRGLRVRILGEWARLQDEEAFPPGDVTDWIRDVLRGQFGAVRIALNNWFVPTRTAERALRFTGAIRSAGWGEWMPPLSQPVDESLRAALAAGIIAEIADVRRLLGYAQQEAASRGSKPGRTAILRLLDQLREVATRAIRYAEEFGIPTDEIRSATDELARDLQGVMELKPAAVWADATAMAGIQKDVEARHGKR